MTTLDLLGGVMDGLCSKLNETEPGSDEYFKIANNLKLVQEMILKEQKAETDNEFRNLEEDRAERQLILEEKKEERIQEEARKPFWRRIDPNAIVSAIVTLLCTILILDFEKLGNITSKAMSILPKPRFK